MTKPKPRFFTTQNRFRGWLEKNHDTKDELIVAYYKKASGKPSMTWSESVDQALCFGWIDGVRRSIDDVSYCIRFTPRRPRSIWSPVNIKKMRVLSKEGLLTDAGKAAYRKRSRKRSERYSYEQRDVQLAPEYEKKIKANRKAWSYWQKLAPSYKKQSIWWVMSAKKEETRLRRLGILIESSATGEKIPPLVVSKKRMGK